jgi:hypothetical protein
MKGTAPSGRVGRGGTGDLALKRQAIQIPPFQGDSGLRSLDETAWNPLRPPRNTRSRSGIAGRSFFRRSMTESSASTFPYRREMIRRTEIHGWNLLQASLPCRLQHQVARPIHRPEAARGVVPVHRGDHSTPGWVAPVAGRHAGPRPYPAPFEAGPRDRGDGTACQRRLLKMDSRSEEPLSRFRVANGICRVLGQRIQ